MTHTRYLIQSDIVTLVERGHRPTHEYIKHINNLNYSTISNDLCPPPPQHLRIKGIVFILNAGSLIHETWRVQENGY